MLISPSIRLLQSYLCFIHIHLLREGNSYCTVRHSASFFNFADTEGDEGKSSTISQHPKDRPDIAEKCDDPSSTGKLPRKWKGCRRAPPPPGIGFWCGDCWRCLIRSEEIKLSEAEDGIKYGIRLTVRLQSAG